jgi:Ca2+-dependent lipid-binding protein
MTTDKMDSLIYKLKYNLNCYKVILSAHARSAFTFFKSGSRRKLFMETNNKPAIQEPKIPGSWDNAIDASLQPLDPILNIENAKISSLLIGAVLSTYTIAYFRLGFGYVILLVWGVFGIYNKNLTRLKSRVRRESLVHYGLLKLDSSTESVEWLNSFLAKFWILYEPGLSEMIKGIVNDILEVSKPTFLEDLRLTTFTLGSIAPRIQSIRTHTNTSDEVLVHTANKDNGLGASIHSN